jgi:cytochrome c oxidase subunit 4
MSHDSPHGFDPTDPHGEHTHAHKIVPVFTLRLVLVVLLVFTALTIGAAQLELWVQNYFDITLPRWINVIGVLTIATIKGLLVMGYFMQLKFDNPINAVIMAFTFLAFAIFLGFTGLDLSTRDRIYAYKAVSIQEGGTGVGMVRRSGESIAGPIVVYEREKAIARLGREAYEAKKAQIHAKYHGHPRARDASSSANVSRPRTGLTPGLFDAAEPDPHGSDRSGH